MIIERDGDQWTARHRYTEEGKPSVLCIGLGDTYSEASGNCTEAVVARIYGAAPHGT
jgi:hypothetical protein